jgi:hypothetical protein
MKSTSLALAAFLALAAGPAFAAHCPVHVKAIDEAMEGDTGLSDEQLAEAKALRDEGEQLHNEGKHDESMEKLHEAMEMLSLEHS